uniref:Polyamine and amino acid transporter-like protein n=1 Tax=Marsilea vestita TaxID=59764 RepID=I6WUN7_MARVE|nr:polyamine and amino acid transporter-like protein [Marsilea vestita]
MALLVVVLSPFVAMTFWGLPRLNFDWTQGQTPTEIDWGKFITLLLWNCSGYQYPPF